MSALPIRGLATSGTSARKGSSEPSGDGRRDVAVVLAKEGLGVLESHRCDHSHEHHQDGRQDHRQEFYAGLKKPREVEHDAQVHRAYLREARRVGKRGALVERIALDCEPLVEAAQVQ
jgi:hypothetical protein